MRRKNTKRVYSIFILVFMSSWLALALPGSTLANGGTIIFPTSGKGGDVGNFNVTVTESPSPPSPDTPVHLSVLLTKRASDVPVRDASIIFSPNMSSMAMPETGSRRSFPGQQPNTYDVDLPMSMEGDWTVSLQIHSPTYGDANLDINLKVEKVSPPWPFIIGILVGLPVLAVLTWWLLFRGNGGDDDDEDENNVGTRPQSKTEQSQTS